MIVPVLDKWTIVIAGKWNVGIFNLTWLKEHIFENPEILVGVGLEPGTPRRITGDKILLIPTQNKLIINPTELEDPTLIKSEGIAVKLLDILPHTPCTGVGINFGYKVDSSSPVRSEFSSVKATEFASVGLTISSRKYSWKLDYEDLTINLNCEIPSSPDEDISFEFNFHSDVTNSNEAKECISEKFLSHRQKAEQILAEVFGQIMEDENE